MLNKRNKAQIDVHDRVERSNAQSAVQRTIAPNLVSWQHWVDHGYAAAFAEAWDRCKMRDIDAITTYVLSCANTRMIAAKITDAQTQHAPGYSQFVS